MSLEKNLVIENDVATHLNAENGLFIFELLDDNDLENADETYFILHVDNGRTLRFSDLNEVNKADFAIGGENLQ